MFAIVKVTSNNVGGMVGFEWRDETGRVHRGGRGLGPLSHLIGQMAKSVEAGPPNELAESTGGDELERVRDAVTKLGQTLSLKQGENVWSARIGAITREGRTPLEAARRALRDARSSS
jgi:hypothetical protein